MPNEGSDRFDSHLFLRRRLRFIFNSPFSNDVQYSPTRSKRAHD